MVKLSSCSELQALKNVGAVGEWRESYTLYDIPEKSGSLLEVIVQNHKTLLPDDTIGQCPSLEAFVEFDSLARFGIAWPSWATYYSKDHHTMLHS